MRCWDFGNRVRRDCARLYGDALHALEWEIRRAAVIPELNLGASEQPDVLPDNLNAENRVQARFITGHIKAVERGGVLIRELRRRDVPVCGVRVHEQKEGVENGDRRTAVEGIILELCDGTLSATRLGRHGAVPPA